jgi:hypothetical protein
VNERTQGRRSKRKPVHGVSMSTRVLLDSHTQILGVYFTQDWLGATDSLDRYILWRGGASLFSSKTKATEPIEPDGLRRPESVPTSVCTDSWVSRSWQYA